MRLFVPVLQHERENVRYTYQTTVLMNRAQYDTGFAGRLKLKVEAVPTLKEHKSEPQAVNETVLNVCVTLALGV